MTQALGIHRDGGVLTLTIQRPDRRNALSREVLRELTQALTNDQAGNDQASNDQASTDQVDSVQAVILTGSDGHFSAGADFAELTGTAQDVTYDDEVARAVTAIRDSPRPVVAAIAGACLGAAVDLALACDVRVAERTAYLQVPAARLGLLYNPAALLRMRDALPNDTLARLLLLGERFDADSAHQAGLVSRVVPEGTAVEHARAMLSDVTPEGSEARAATKALLADPQAATRAEHWESVRRDLLDSPARQRAVAAARARHTTHQGQEDS